MAYLADFARLGQVLMPTWNQLSTSFALALAVVVQGALQAYSIHSQPHRWAQAVCWDRCRHAPEKYACGGQHEWTDLKGLLHPLFS